MPFFARQEEAENQVHQEHFLSKPKWEHLHEPNEDTTEIFSGRNGPNDSDFNLILLVAIIARALW